MARKSPLKVFRTPIGFHDAYVAAASRKAALEAWGAEKDLFASGSAELVTDPALTAEALASPGKVIKRSRGSLTEHLRAAGRSVSPDKRTRAERLSAPTVVQRPRALKPRPSRAPVERAETALQAFEARTAAERAALDKREAQLLKDRKALNARHRRDAGKLEARLEQARERYEQALQRWRED